MTLNSLTIENLWESFVFLPNDNQRQAICSLIDKNIVLVAMFLYDMEYELMLVI